MDDRDSIRLYLEANLESSTPIIYRRMALVTLIAGVLGRQVWVQDGDRKVFPNMYTMLIGDSGSKKSTAIVDAVSFMGKIGYTNFPNIRSSSDKFLDDFADRNYDRDGMSALDAPSGVTSLTLALDEAKDFFCAGGTDISAALTRIYDCPPYYENSTRGTGAKRIEAPILSYIGGATPQSFAEIIPPISYQQGLLARTLIVFESVKPPYVAQPRCNKSQLDYAARLLSENLQQATGQISMEPDALAMLNDLGVTSIGPTDSRLRSYRERRRDHLLKLSLVMAIARGERVISKKVMVQANTVLVYCESSMHFGIGGYGLNRNGAAATEVITSILYSNGNLLHDDLATKLGLASDNLAQLSELMHHLMKCGLVTSVNPTDGKPGYFSVMKRAPFMETFSSQVESSYMTEYSHSKKSLRTADSREAHNRLKEFKNENSPVTPKATSSNSQVRDADRDSIANLF